MNDSDCTLAIQVDTCCACPLVASRQWVDADDGVEIYIPGTSYSQLLPSLCGSVDCAPCPPAPAAAVCSQQGQCAAPEDANTVLKLCPTCIPQAAMTAYLDDQPDLAIEMCRTAVEQESCFMWLLETALDMQNLEHAELLCREHIQQDQAGCLLLVAEAWSSQDVERALSICQGMDPSGVHYFSCIETAAMVTKDKDPQAALDLCNRLQPDRAELCRQDVMRE